VYAEALMALYAVAERRLQPGQLDAYLAALRALDAHLAGQPHRGPYTVYTAEADPDQVLSLGLWRRVEDLEEASSSMPAALVAQLDAAVAEGEWHWDWYESVRQVRSFAGTASLVAAARFRVDAARLVAFYAWARRVQDLSIALPGVLTMHLLESRAREGEFIHLAEYDGHEARRIALEMLEAEPPPTPLRGLRRFLGRRSYHWDRG
jgi:quinol monooxygenase YgiN